MKTRITYIHGGDGQFGPEQNNVENGSISISGIRGAREVKTTFGLDELPQEVRQVLKQSHDLYMRWAAERPCSAAAPFASRVSPGFHVSYTPPKGEKAGNKALCALLRATFSNGINCSLHGGSFIASPLTASQSLHFFERVPTLDNFVSYIQRNICRPNDAICSEYTSQLRDADSLDINYQNGSSSLDIIAYWSHSRVEEGWTEKIHKQPDGKVEVGLLATQGPPGPEELRVGGFLAVVGEDRKLKPTLFSFPSRHHVLRHSSVYQASFPAPTGLHPTLKLSIPRDGLSPPSSNGACSLHTFLTLPSTIFADKYQLSTTDPLFLQSHNLVSLRSIAGETDLEIPDWVTERWGSNLLLELTTPQTRGSASNDETSDNWEVTIPLHIRYLHPSPSGHRNISIPWPIVFWACAGSGEAKFDNNPFDRRNLGWDELFTPQTMFYQFHPSPSDQKSETGEDSFTFQPKLSEEIQVPVLSIDDGPMGSMQTRNIELGTVSVIVVGFAWVLWRLASVASATGLGPSSKNIKKTRSGKMKGT